MQVPEHGSAPHAPLGPIPETPEAKATGTPNTPEDALNKSPGTATFARIAPGTPIEPPPVQTFKHKIFGAAAAAQKASSAAVDAATSALHAATAARLAAKAALEASNAAALLSVQDAPRTSAPPPGSCVKPSQYQQR